MSLIQEGAKYYDRVFILSEFFLKNQTPSQGKFFIDCAKEKDGIMLAVYPRHTLMFFVTEI